MINCAGPDGVLLLTYPSPEYQRYLMQERPDELQIVDNVIEIEALFGEASAAETLLRQATYVKVEASDFESYKGGATVETIEEFLRKSSFRLERRTQFAAHPFGKGYFDLLFRRLGVLRLGNAAW
jgi:hypothetical protein